MGGGGVGGKGGKEEGEEEEVKRGKRKCREDMGMKNCIKKNFQIKGRGNNRGREWPKTTRAVV